MTENKKERKKRNRKRINHTMNRTKIKFGQEYFSSNGVRRDAYGNLNDIS